MSREVQEMTVYQLLTVFEYEGVKIEGVEKVITKDKSLEVDNDIDILVHYGGEYINLTIGTHELSKMIDLDNGKEYAGLCEKCSKVMFDAPIGLAFMCPSCVRVDAYQSWG